MSLPRDTEISPSQPKAASAPSTPIPTAPPSQDITAAHKMSEAGTEYFMPDLASPLSTLGRGLVPFTTAPKTLGIDWRYGAQGKHKHNPADSLSFSRLVCSQASLVF